MFLIISNQGFSNDLLGPGCALLENYEGEAQWDQVKDTAYSAISAAQYHKEKKKFSFENYDTIDQET